MYGAYLGLVLSTFATLNPGDINGVRYDKIPRMPYLGLSSAKARVIILISRIKHITEYCIVSAL